MAKLHPFDLLADDLAQWIEDTATQLAAALMEGGMSPFAANVNPKKQLAYYDAQFFNPDGTPNMGGRQALLDRLGVTDYARAMSRVIIARQQGEGATPAGGGGFIGGIGGQ